MRVYSVPPDINEKEKIIGGFMDIGQFVWIICGVILGLITGISLFFVIKKIGIIIGVIVSFSGVPFAFKKVEGLTLFEYLRKKRVFNKKNKYLPNKRVNQVWK